ncbi:PepSY domain-containing protein [Candidatus Woesearchaeota archaeon]|nr:PepSY domain-containing protein [Candidatus Woesearchaeota archaeon]
MDLKPALKKLEESREFRTWRQKNKDTYFSYAFKIPQEMNPDDWQMGFYSKKKDRITAFVMAGGSVNIRPEEEVFKKEDAQVHQVQIGKVKVTFNDAMAKAGEFQQKNFPKDRSVKTIAILQNIPELGNIWNVTYVTEAFNTLNIKIDASSGKVLEHHLASVFSFRK